MAVVLLSLAGFPVQAQTYDMNRFLNEPYPFARSSRATAAVVVTPMAPRAPSAPTAIWTTPRAIPATEIAAVPDDEGPAFGFISEIRGGALLHDVGPFSSKKESGTDLNLEILFASPDLFEIIWSPRPQLGVSYNSSGHTSQAYLALQWEMDFWDDWFAGFSFGGMIHDGRLYGDKGGDKRKSLGCRLLFREAIDIGYRFQKRHAVMLHFEHSSNASLCKKETPDGTELGRHTVVLNEGLELLGLRYGYLF